MMWTSRVNAWLSKKTQELSPDLFADLKLRTENAVPEVVDQIDKDLCRLSLPMELTGEHHEMIRGALRNVLLAYSIHDPAVGYCQGMHCVAASALLPEAGAGEPLGLADEENAFLWLDMVVHDILPRYYLPGLPGLLEEQAMLARLLQKQKPAVYTHLEGM